MNQAIKTIFYICCTVLFTTANCFAFAIVGDAQWVKMGSSANRPSNFVGGEFTLTTSLGEEYAAFCVEWEEHIYLNKHYRIDSVENYANRGGGGGSYGNNGAVIENGEYRDYLSIETKWLMNEYVNGGLKTLYASESGKKLGAAMQVAIWKLENEHYKKRYENYYGDLADELIAQALLGAADLDDGFDNVKVINLAGAQSQIIAEPVPEPATMLLLGISLIGLAGIGRKKLKK